MDKEQLKGSAGPLGDMAHEYAVKLARSSYEGEEKKPEGRKMSAHVRRRSRPPRNPTESNKNTE